MALSAVALQSSSGETGENVASRVIDISAIGVCLVAQQALQEGAALKVEISLPGSRAKHVTRGVVRWVTSLEAKGEKAFAAGLEFESVIDALAGRLGDSAILDAFLTLRVAVAQLLVQGDVPVHGFDPGLGTCAHAGPIWGARADVAEGFTASQPRAATRPGASRPAPSSTAMQVMDVTATRKLAVSSCPACTAS